MKKILLVSIIITLAFTISITSAYAQTKYEIPSWIKVIAGFWLEGKITDDEFGDGLSFLINKDIIKVREIKELQDKVSKLESENADLKSQLNLPKLAVLVSEVKQSETLGKYIDIKVVNASRTVEIQIKGFGEELMADLLIPVSSTGEVNTQWVFPADLIPLTYTVIAKDTYNTATTTFKVK